MLIKSPRGRLAVVIAILAVVSIATVAVTIHQLYRVALREERARLRERVQSQVRLAEAVARFDSRHSPDAPGGFREATISQIQDAHSRFEGCGRTGKLVVGQRMGDNLVFVLRNGGKVIERISSTPLENSRAEPMRRAVLGQSGVIVARDWQGKEVLAAYAPVGILNLGMVAKIDLAEIRSPFVWAGVVSGAFALLLVGVGAYAIVRVTSPMARAEEEMAAQHSLLDDVMNNVPHLVFWKDTESVYLGCNAEFARAAGVEKPEDVVGKTDFDLAWTREQAESYRCDDRRVIENSGPLLDVEESLNRSDGTEAAMLTSKVPLRDGRGRLIGVLGVSADITQHKATEEALRDREDQLRHKQKMETIGGLAGGIAHEFNNLLQAIRGYAEFAMNQLPAQEQPHQDIQQVVTAADRAADLTRQLLDFSRRRPLEKEIVDANRLVRDLTKMLRPILGEHIEVLAELAENAGTVCVDPHVFQQALLNLCINARDAMPAGGKLLLRTDNVPINRKYADGHLDLKPGQYVRLSVTDSGCGIQPEMQKRVFEPFFTTKEVGKGTGLGLSMVYGTVQQHGGAMHLYSEPARGTTFRIYLPAAGAPDAQRGQQTSPAARGGHETILVAEDDSLVQDIAVRVLQQAGYTVLRADDGEAALGLVAQHGTSISLALLDVVMPKLGGRDVYQQIEALAPAMKVVFCTGYDPSADQAEFIQQSGLRLVEKPYTADTLLRIIREVLDAKSRPLPAGLDLEAAAACEAACVG